MVNSAIERACFAAGCFWGIQAIFDKVDGVISTAVGYTGGVHKNPTYHEVCTAKTGHAEAVLIEYDPAKVTYEELLDLFWQSHNPTQVNRQGPDVGTQYRSAIFYFTSDQKALAEKSKQRLQGLFDKKIATEIEPAQVFHRAEEYHQHYLAKRGGDVCS